MPFVRFARDKRGYEHVYLVHTPVRRGKPGRPRVLYWYRSPPGVKVGREAFDAGVRRALETRYPDLTFDWDTLAAPPPPAPVLEPWRERRRLQKARRARASTAPESEADVELSADDPSAPVPEPLDTDVDLLAEPAPVEEPVVQVGGDEVAGVAAVPVAGRIRRRRRGGRRRPGRGPVAAAESSGEALSEPPVDPSPSSDDPES